MLITSPEFTSNLTVQNPVFGIFCIISMLAHPTSQCLTSFTNIQKSTECTFYAINDIFKHRYDAKDPKYRILYNHFNQPGHDRCLTMKVRIIEKIYHHTNSPKFEQSRGSNDLV
jgi:hypothetical protein